jgi:MSHA biogenesis protein MshJ
MKLDSLRNWVARRRLREKVLAGLAVLVAAGSLVDSLVYAPQREQAAALRKQIELTRQGLDKLQALAAQQTEQSDASTSAYADALAARRTQAEAVIRAAQADLIAPQDMARQLNSMLARHPQLRIVSMSTQAPTPVQDPAAALSGATPAATPAAALPTAGLYQHGLELRVEGRYLDVLDWLVALEQAPHRIYWRELDLQVGQDGMPITRIALFTLSRESTWLRL